MMLKAITCILSVIVAHGAAYSQGWKGIEPLHSNCEDVRRLLGVQSCGNETYDLEDVRVSIVFSEENCASEWNVPPGTVLSLDVYPKRAVRFVDLHVDERKFKKEVDQTDPTVIRYKNFHDGTSIIVQPNGIVTVMSYEPAAKDSHLRCPAKEVTNEQQGDVGFLKIDAYGNISTREESKRLDEFVTNLKTQPPIKAYIVAYGGRKSWPGEAKHRANCVKEYLVKKHKIAERWVTAIDGGYQEQAIVELYISLTGDPPITSPTLDRKDVQIIKERGMRGQRKCLLTSRVPTAHSVQPRTLRKSH